MEHGPSNRNLIRLVAVFICAGLTAVPTARGGDTDAPVVLVLPAEPQTSGQTLSVRARIIDPSGVERATLWVAPGGAREFLPFPFEARDGDVFEARVPRSATRNCDRIVYYIEAHDRAGNDPRFSGNPRVPFVIRLQPAVPGIEPAGNSPVPALMLVASMIALGLGWLFEIKARRERVQAGAREAADTAGRRRDPAAGKRGRTRREFGGESRHIPSDSASRLFWLKLLLPLLDLRPEDRERALVQLSARRHDHPALGLHFFNRATLSRHLAWVSDPAARRGATPAPADGIGRLVSSGSGLFSPRRSQAGASLVELLVIVAILALALSLAVVAFDAMEAPLQSAGEMIQGKLRQTRARAVSSTTPHRLRPISDTALVIESGTSCTAGPWVLDSGSQLELPAEVTLTSTAWSVCYISRGVTEQNQLIGFTHPDLGSRQVETLLGGAVKWVP